MESPSLTATRPPSHIATISGALGVASVLLFALGPVTIQLGVASAFIGFRIFTVGILFALLALVLGAIALWRTRATSGRSGRSRAGVGFGLGAAGVALVVALVSSAGNVPTINDITTDPDDPPEFVAAALAEANAGRDLSYPGASVAAQQRKAYPDLAPLHLQVVPVVAFQRARKAAADLGWQTTAIDRIDHTFEAIDVTRVFRFVDDIVVRVRATDASGLTSVVDVRSKSRDGRGDMGANAARIRAFLAAMEKGSG